MPVPRPLALAPVLFAVVTAGAASLQPTDPPSPSAPPAAEAPVQVQAPAPDAGAPEVSLDVPSREEDPPLADARPLPKEADLLARAVLKDGRFVVEVDGQEHALTLQPLLQQKLTEILRSYQTPYAAVVALDPKTGRVLAMAEHSEADPSMRGLPVKAVFPAASIFKIVTASALMEAGVQPEDRECTHGGKRRVTQKHLQDSARDTMCLSLSQALAQSANGIFAKMTARHLSAERLRRWVDAFHFNQPFDFPVPTEMSLAAVPEDEFGLARTGAGFGDVFLSPLHGAALASVAANEGRWVQPLLFEDQTQPEDVPQVMTGAEAEKLTAMMEETVTDGTARRIFRQRGFKVPGAVGKTGSLADKRPFRDYSWFVGFAPKDNPKVAVAAVIVNGYYWRIRATWLGREAMRLYLDSLPTVHASSL